MIKHKFLLFLIIWIALTITGILWYFEGHGHSHQQFSTAIPSVSSSIVTDPLLRFCNVPQFNQYNGREGQLQDDHDLIGVITIYRHGDRGPLTSIISDLKPINCSSYVSEGFRKLESIVLGKKKNPKLDSILPKSDFCKPGHLTKQGSSQLIELGNALKNSYKKYFNFSDPDITKNIETFSTPYSRTIQSLTSLMFGLMGSKLFMEVPGHYNAEVPFCFKYCRCEAAAHFEKLHKKELVSSFKDDSKTGNFSGELKYLQRDFKWFNKDTLPSTIKDVMLTYICHDHSLPCNANGLCLNLTFGAALNHFLQYEALVSAGSLNLKKASILRAFGLLNNIDQHINSWISSYKIRNSSKDVKFPKLLLYSGHDLTLMYLLSTLNLYDGYLPAYGSRLVIEIFSDKVRYYSRVLWNGQDVSKHLPPCSSANVTLCNARFIPRYLKSQMQTHFETDKFSEACES